MFTYPELDTIPQEPGVYTFWADGRAIYVGKAKDLRARLASYPRSDNPRTMSMLKAAQKLDWVVLPSEKDALVWERERIRTLNPKYNIKLKGAGRAPRLKLTPEQVPRLEVSTDGEGYGPWPGTRTQDVLKTVRNLTGVATCSASTFKQASAHCSPCTLAQLGKCSAPCVDADGYGERVETARKILQGKGQEVVAAELGQMKNSSDRQEYEQAAMHRDRAVSIRELVNKQTIISDKDETFWAVSVNQAALTGYGLVKVEHGVMVHLSSGTFVQGAEEDARQAGEATLMDTILGWEGEGKVRVWVDGTPTRRESVQAAWVLARKVADEASRLEALAVLADPGNLAKGAQSLAEAAGVDGPVYTLDAVDIAHMYGKHAYAGFVRLEDGQVTWRKAVAVPEEHAGDDVASLTWAGQWYQKHRQGADLLLVDGGEISVKAVAGQVATPTAGLAKRMEVLVVGEDEVVLGRQDKGLLLAMRARDHAHRVANKATSKAASASLTVSGFQALAGVGPTRAKILRERYGSVEGAREASVEELEALPGIGKSSARSIHRQLRAD